jgi:hypothetical protein
MRYIYTALLIILFSGFVLGEKTVKEYKDAETIYYYRMLGGNNVSGYIQNPITGWKLSWDKTYYTTSDGKKFKR